MLEISLCSILAQREISCKYFIGGFTMADKTYAEQQNIKYTKKLNELLKILPPFCTEYFNSLEYSKQPRTKIAYAMDIKGFFEFLIIKHISFPFWQDVL